MSHDNPSVYLEKIIKKTNLTEIQNQDLKKNLSIVSKKIESQKAVYTSLIVLLVKKILNPNQDIRYHQKGLANGFSARDFDKKFITPIMKKYKLPSMAESAWLTRSLEQPHALNKNFPGKIKDSDVKNSFLEIIDSFQKTPSNCLPILNYLINEGKKIKEKNFIPAKKIKTKDKIFINDFIKLLVTYLKFDFKTSGASKVPTLCIYTAYQIFFKEFSKFKKLTLKKIGSHTTSDRTSNSAGDIEIFEKENLLEAFEIKFNIEPNAHLLEIIYEKIKKFNPKKYFIIHTSFINEKKLIVINKKIEEIKEEHGCQIIVDNLFLCLSSYLRLIENVEDYVNLLSQNIIEDKELKLAHKEKWKKMLEKFN